MNKLFGIMIILVSFIFSIGLAVAEEKIDYAQFEGYLNRQKVVQCTVHTEPDSGVTRITAKCKTDTGVIDVVVKPPYGEDLMQRIQVGNIESFEERSEQQTVKYLLTLILPLLIIVFGLIILIFWIWMLADCLKRDHPKEMDKLIWSITIIFTTVIGAALYWFIQPIIYPMLH